METLASGLQSQSALAAQMPELAHPLSCVVEAMPPAQAMVAVQ
jgi:hypothetical protein